MSNKSSPHGGFICEGTVSHGTLRTPDLLRAFADEYERILPFNSRELVTDAHNSANEIDADPGHPGNEQCGSEIVCELIDAIDACAVREGLTFGAHEGDGSDFGYWRTDDANDE
jgi:hypothetical protein